MEVSTAIIVATLLAGSVGLIGGMVMVKLIDRGNIYIFDHPPDEEENKKGEISK